MRFSWLMACAIGLLATPTFAQDAVDPVALKAELVQRETDSWVAWQAHDGRFFEQFLSDDHVEIQSGGRATKASVVAGVASPICSVKDYKISNFELTVFGPATALLTYRAEQDTICGTAKVPTPVWASSLFVKRDGRWVNALYVHTPIQ